MASWLPLKEQVRRCRLAGTQGLVIDQRIQWQKPGCPILQVTLSPERPSCFRGTSALPPEVASGSRSSAEVAVGERVLRAPTGPIQIKPGKAGKLIVLFP